MAAKNACQIHTPTILAVLIAHTVRVATPLTMEVRRAKGVQQEELVSGQEELVQIVLQASIVQAA